MNKFDEKIFTKLENIPETEFTIYNNVPVIFEYFEDWTQCTFLTNKKIKKYTYPKGADIYDKAIGKEMSFYKCLMLQQKEFSLMKESIMLDYYNTFLDEKINDFLPDAILKNIGRCINSENMNGLMKNETT